MKKLKEAFSPSMPKWLRNLMLKNYLQDSTRQFNAPKKLFSLLNSLGYDLSKAEFVEIPVPQTLQDPIFYDYQKLPIIHIVTDNDDTFMIPGITDELKYTNNNHDLRVFKQFNNKNLKDYGKDAVYIDLSKNTHMIPQDVLNRPGINKFYQGNAFDWSDRGAGHYMNSLSSDEKQKLKQSNRSTKNVRNRYFPLLDKSGFYRGDEIISDRLKTALN